MQLMKFGAPLLLPALLCQACGEPPANPTIAAAVNTENKTQKTTKKLEEAEAKKLADAKAARAAQAAALEEALASAVKLPAQMPTDLETACDQFVESFDAFMKAGSETDVLEWWDGRRKKLGHHRAKCMTRDSMEVAACGSVALAQPLGELDAVDRTEAAQLVLQRCDDEFGNG